MKNREKSTGKLNRAWSSFAIIAVAFAAAFLPLAGCEKQNPVKEQAPLPQPATPTETSLREYELRERCGSYCTDFFHKTYREKMRNQSENFTTQSDYTSHYNRKMNRCYMLVKSKSTSVKNIGSVVLSEHLVDAHENHILGAFTMSVRDSFTDIEKNRTLGEATLSGREHILSECRLLDTRCKSRGEWEKLIQPYMEE